MSTESRELGRRMIFTGGKKSYQGMMSAGRETRTGVGVGRGVVRGMGRRMSAGRGKEATTWKGRM